MSGCRLPRVYLLIRCKNACMRWGNVDRRMDRRLTRHRKGRRFYWDRASKTYDSVQDCIDEQVRKTHAPSS